MKLYEAATLVEAAKVGRDYQHVEDLLIVDGAAGGMEAVDELEDSIDNTHTMDFKWDGGASVFWGRDENGTFIFAPKNQWLKGVKHDKRALQSEIMNTGRKYGSQSDEEFAAIRQQMASQYGRLWSIFEEATPSKFRGFLNGDLMFTEKQQPTDSGKYVFTPNKITYTVEPNGLGGKIKTAEAFVVVHGKVEHFGESVESIAMVDDNIANAFNRSPKLIVLNTQHPHKSLERFDALDHAKQFIQQHAQQIDQIANFSAPKFTTLKNIMYTYSVAYGKKHGNLDFETWLEGSKVSANQKATLTELMQTPNWKIFWQAFDLLVKAKYEMLDQIMSNNNEHMSNNLGITASIGDNVGGEGVVKKRRGGGGHIKLVNPHFRSAEVNARFNSGE